MRQALLLLVLAALLISPAMGQLLPQNEVGVTMGHIHLAVKDVDAQKAFFTNIMHGKLVKNGPLELIEFPGVYIMLRKAEPTDPPAGSILNHFGFVVKDMPATLEWWKKNNMNIPINTSLSWPWSILSRVENCVTIVFLLLSSLNNLARRVMRISL